MLVTSTTKEVWKCIFCIYYLVFFWKALKKIWALFDFENKVNIITPTYAVKLGFFIKKTNVKTQKINKSALKMLRIVLDNYQAQDKLSKLCFFQETFVVADISKNLFLKMTFLTFSNVYTNFVKKKFT